eukprot:COSAG04_NODE_5126_length_1727_cov_15.898649_2_plen_213_part_00
MAPARRYKEIEEISGQSCGVQYSGGVNFACTPDRWQYLRNEWAKHRTMGIDSALLTPEQVKDKCPPLNVEAGETTGAIIGGLFDQNEGYLDCSGVTWAYAKSAQKGGAKIHQHTKVDGLTQVRDDSTETGWAWDIKTDSGVVRAEHIVNCGGLWAREVGEMAGVHLPLLPMQHHCKLRAPPDGREPLPSTSLVARSPPPLHRVLGSPPKPCG